MCGIVGFWDLKHQTPTQLLESTLIGMRDTLVHRGPDGAGNWCDATQGIGLAHRRLSILDLSPHGHQPMLSVSGRYVITFNGEIYNHQALKQRLIAAQCAPQWRGHSDTEIILAAFEAWGVVAAVQQFVGMFAIALWDRQEKQLHLIRDRMGEKPLYYGWLKHCFVFGSELKALKQHFAWQQEIDRNAVALLMQYNCIPAPHTIYQDIYKLEPGHILTVSPDQSMTNVAYWQLKDVINNNAPLAIDPARATVELEHKLREAIQLQMLADVPVGAFLSGGIDSSTIVALMQAQSTKPVKTFTIGFDDPTYNEATYAKAIAQHLQTDHTELYLAHDSAQSIIPDLATFYDEPFADVSQLPTYIVSRLTREHVTVSLSGDGGDELFAGYNRYALGVNIWKKLGYLPRPARLLLAKLITTIAPRHWNKVLAPFSSILPRVLRHSNPGDKLYKLAAIVGAKNFLEIYGALLSHWPGDDPSLQALTTDINRTTYTELMMYIDSMRYLPDDILVKVDRAAMAVSLETRVPFLDHRVVEYAWSLPLDVKIKNNQNKWILRQILNRYVPAELYDRPKMGFGVPIDQWIRGPLKEWAHDLLSSSMLNKHNVLDAKLIQKRWQEHLNGVGNWHLHLWNVLVFQAWCDAQNG